MMMLMRDVKGRTRKIGNFFFLVVHLVFVKIES